MNMDIKWCFTSSWMALFRNSDRHSLILLVCNNITRQIIIRAPLWALTTSANYNLLRHRSVRWCRDVFCGSPRQLDLNSRRLTWITSDRPSLLSATVLSSYIYYLSCTSSSVVFFAGSHFGFIVHQPQILIVCHIMAIKPDGSSSNICEF